MLASIQPNMHGFVLTLMWGCCFLVYIPSPCWSNTHIPAAEWEVVLRVAEPIPSLWSRSDNRNNSSSSTPIHGCPVRASSVLDWTRNASSYSSRLSWLRMMFMRVNAQGANCEEWFILRIVGCVSAVSNMDGVYLCYRRHNGIKSAFGRWFGNVQRLPVHTEICCKNKAIFSRNDRTKEIKHAGVVCLKVCLCQTISLREIPNPV